MPIYEYYCQKCQNDCELLIRGSEKPVCPRCGSCKLQRQMSAPAAHTGGTACSAADFCERRPNPGCGGCAGRCPY
ncbi:MAG: zinc ribbon domain-containing protein [Planctomycetaceae bacterium]|nr:zinc ribbon domain-containing protein [Planctomycetaceae bacterium]